MFYRFLIMIVLSVAALGSADAAFAQTGEANKSGSPVKPNDDDKDDVPHGIRENLIKLRIEKEKREFDQMLERGQELVKLSDELEKEFAATGKIPITERPKIETVEKLAKKIRNELGGDDDGDDTDDAAAGSPAKTSPLSPSNAFQTLKTRSAQLYEELKKGSRFTISAAAIQSSNAVLKIAKFLKISN